MMPSMEMCGTVSVILSNKYAHFHHYTLIRAYFITWNELRVIGANEDKRNHTHTHTHREHGIDNRHIHTDDMGIAGKNHIAKCCLAHKAALLATRCGCERCERTRAAFNYSNAPRAAHMPCWNSHICVCTFGCS